MDKLPPPVVPRTFYAAGLNYRAHIEWANSRGASHNVPAQPDIGYRAASALIGSGHDIVIPKDSTGPVEFEFEGRFDPALFEKADAAKVGAT